MCIVTTRGEVLQANRVLSDLLGYPSEVALRTHGEEGPFADPAVLEALANAKLTDGPVTKVTLSLKTAGGPLLPVCFECIALAGVASEPGYVLTVDGPSGIHAQASSAPDDDPLPEVTRAVAHDLKSVLTVIRGRAHFLQTRMHVDSPFQEDLNSIHESATYAEHLSHQLLGQPIDSVPGVVDLTEAITKSQGLLASLFADTVTLSVQHDDGPLPVRMPRDKLDRILFNLVTNARDAMPQKGHVCITVQHAEPRPERGDSGRLRFGASLSVTDDGVGMDDGTKARMFEELYTTKPTGAGLGLAIVHDFVHGAGGDIEVESSLGHGTTIRVWLPLAVEVTSTNEDGVSISDAGSGRNDTSRRRVLLVEDEPDIRWLISKSLSMAGYEIVAASDGIDALALWGQIGHVDMVVTDLRMPRMDGTELVARLRTYYPGTPVLFISGYYDDLQAVAERTHSGPTALLRKPFGLRDIREQVDRLLVAESVDSPSVQRR